MEQTQTQENEIIDLGFDVNEADVARPILKDGTYDFIIRTTKRETSKNNHPMLAVAFGLASPAEDVNGNTVNPGFTITQRYLMKPTGKMTQEMINDRFKRVHFAAAGEGAVNTGAWVGKTVKCRVKVREAEGEYAASNDITAVLPKKD